MGKYDTSLSLADEKLFQVWKAQYAPHDSGADYDLRGAFKAGLTPDPQTGHWPDTFKKPNHPTFSDQSMYAVGEDAKKAGHWIGDVYQPATGNKTMGDGFNLQTQAPTLATSPVPQGSDLYRIMAMWAPYFQEQARAQQQVIPQIVQARHAIAGGGHRDMAGNLMNPDPLAELQRQQAIWDATFGTPQNRVSDRITKERNAFQTPADIPTFTERELAGVNARARMRYGSGGQAQTAAPTPAATSNPPPAAEQSLAALGSPAPTPPTRRVAPAPVPPEPAPAPGPPQARDVSPPFDINSLIKPGPQITPMFAENPPAYVTPEPGTQPQAVPYRYGTGTQPIPQGGIAAMPNFVQPPPTLAPWEMMALGYAPGAGLPRGLNY